MWYDDFLSVDEVLACHLGGLSETHDVENRGCDVGEDTVGDPGVFVLGDVDAGYGVERVSRVGCAVGVDGVIGVAVVCDDDDLVVSGLGGFDCAVDTFVDCDDSFLDGFVDASVAYHVAVGIVDDDKVEFLAADGIDELVADLKGAHLGLEVVCGNLGRGDEDALLEFVGSLASAVEEECDMGILLGLGDMELLLAFARKVFAECILDILFVKEDMILG